MKQNKMKIYPWRRHKIKVGASGKKEKNQLETRKNAPGQQMTMMPQQMTRPLNEQNEYFSRIRKSQYQRKKKLKPSKKEDKQRKEEEMLKELIKAQTEAAKRAKKKKKELFQYLR